MGLGILEDHKLQHVPGTAILEESEQDYNNVQIHKHLKYDMKGSVPIVLIPQPSDDPNDPLNWPLWRRDVIMLILSIDAIIASALSPILSANSLTLLFYFKTGLTETALLTGWHLFAVGLAGFLVVPSARVWGKRHIFLFASILLPISCIWAGYSKTYGSLIGARVLQGIAVCPFEALLAATVGDLYPVHQRGLRMALANLSLYGGAFFSPVIAGVVTTDIRWQWTFFLAAIFGGIMIPFVFLFCPETAFRRNPALNTDFASTDDFHAPSTSTEQLRDNNTSKHLDVIQDDVTLQTPRKKTFVESLKPFDGRKTDDSLWLLAARPLPLFLHPAIAWGALTMGTLIGWTVMVGVVLATIFFGSPFFFAEKQIGFTYSGAFIGAILGFLLSGLLADWSAKYLTKLNKGVYEPEFRILLVFPQLIVGCIGVYGFGFVTEYDYAQAHGWFPPVFFFGLEVMGMTIGAVAAALYIVDAHRDIAIEAFTCLLMFKNFFSFGLTYKAFGWIDTVGKTKLFIILGSAQLFVCLLSVPMYIFGKRNRSFFHRHDILKILHLDTKHDVPEDAGIPMRSGIPPAGH